MENVTCKVTLLKDSAGNEGCMPVYGTARAAGADLYLPRDVTVPANSKVEWIDLLVCFELPPNAALLLMPRSSTSRKWAVSCESGLIDSDYTGPLHCSLINYSGEDAFIPKGTRVAQVVAFSPLNMLALERKAVARDCKTGSGSTGD